MVGLLKGPVGRRWRSQNVSNPRCARIWWRMEDVGGRDRHRVRDTIGDLRIDGLAGQEALDEPTAEGRVAIDLSRKRCRGDVERGEVGGDIEPEVATALAEQLAPGRGHRERVAGVDFVTTAVEPSKSGIPKQKRSIIHRFPSCRCNAAGVCGKVRTTALVLAREGESI